jgi:predicted amidohydrolase
MEVRSTLQIIRIAMLHLKPIAGDLDHNRALIENAVRIASAHKTDWIITPETAVSGLQFDHLIGTDWVEQQPDPWTRRLCELAAAANTWLFLGQPERGGNNEIYNTVFVVGPDGQVIGKQRKILVHSDGWSTPGDEILPMVAGPLCVGIMICADAYTNRVADAHLSQGAKVLVAPSSWGPGLYGPEGEWERRSMETGLPVFVCNRTGKDQSVSFWEAESLVIVGGKRRLTHQSRQSAILLFDWDCEAMDLVSESFQVVCIES